MRRLNIFKNVLICLIYRGQQVYILAAIAQQLSRPAEMSRRKFKMLREINKIRGIMDGSLIGRTLNRHLHFSSSHGQRTRERAGYVAIEVK